MLQDSCFARQGLRRSITILAVCGGSSDRPEPRRLSRVRTLRSLSTEESEPCTPFLMNPRVPEVARAVGGARYYLTSGLDGRRASCPGPPEALPFRRSPSCRGVPRAQWF